MNRLRFAAACFGSLSLAVALTAPVGAVRTATPKLGGTCTKSQSGKTSGQLVCSKSGSAYKWVARQAKAVATTTSPPVTQSPAQVDVIDLVFGTAAPTNATKVDLACSGTFAAGGTEAKSTTFPATGGTNQLAMSLLEPGTTNPTGSSCTVTATVTGSVPSALQILVNGRSQAGPASAATLATPAFTAPGPTVVTVLSYYASIAPTIPATLAPTASTATTLPSATTTTSAGPTTTTLLPGTTTPPPVSGKPEVKNLFLGALPATLSAVDIKVTCTAAVAGGAFQIQSARLGLVPSTASLPLTLIAGTECQAEASLVGAVDGSKVGARFLLNGQPMQGATTGTFINSPNFFPAQAFTVTAEFTFPGANSATTTTIAGATTTSTVLAGTTPPGSASSLVVAPSGSVPAQVNGFKVDLTCSNVISNGMPQPTLTYSGLFGTSGGTINQIPITLTASSQCSIQASTLPTGAGPTGAMTIFVNGADRGRGTGGSASVAAFVQTSPIQVRLTVAY